MADTNDKDQNNASDSAESDDSGEAKASAKVTGESDNKKASAKGEHSGDGLFDGMTPETLHKSYKELQREYSKIQNDIVKKFEAYGGPDQVLEWTEYLSKNPDFATWVAQQKTKSALGVDESQLDDETRKALDAVRKIAKSVVEDEVNKIRQQEIGPLSETYKQSLLESHFVKMDSLYGKDWHEMRDLMSELSEELPDKIQDRPKFEDVEDLYFKALRRSGKLESYAAKKYQQKLTEKKGKSTDRPATGGESAQKPAKSIAEAFRQAKEQVAQ